jgi:hypothetical protein
VWRRAFLKNRRQIFWTRAFLENRIQIFRVESAMTIRAERDEIRQVIGAAEFRRDEVMNAEIADAAAVGALVAVSLSDLASGLLPGVAVELGSAGT